jgi:hypothetical protein
LVAAISRFKAELEGVRANPAEAAEPASTTTAPALAQPTAPPPPRPAEARP